MRTTYIYDISIPKTPDYDRHIATMAQDSTLFKSPGIKATITENINNLLNRSGIQANCVCKDDIKPASGSQQSHTARLEITTDAPQSKVTNCLNSSRNRKALAASCSLTLFASRDGYKDFTDGMLVTDIDSHRTEALCSAKYIGTKPATPGLQR